MKFGLTVTGGHELAARYAALPGKLPQQVIYAALHKSAAVVQEAVRAAAPVGTEPSRKTRRVRTAFVGRGKRRVKLRLNVAQAVAYDYGRLRGNIRRRRLRASTGEVGVQVTRGRAFWAFFLEQGTSRMRPHPFWQAASRGAEARARVLFEAEFRRLLAVAMARP